MKRIKSWFLAIRIALLKRRARRQYAIIDRLLYEYDCGRQLIDMATGGALSRAEADFGATIEILRSIDPDMQ